MPAGKHKQARWSQSVPHDWLQHIERRCKHLKMTRAEYIRTLIQSDLPDSVADKLSEPQRAGRPSA